MTQPFKNTIGIIGGGQLGKMLIESALPWNVSFNILEQSQDCPSFRYASTFIEGSLMDSSKIMELAEISDVITYEIEHVNVETLKALEAKGKTVIPAANILEIIQNKGTQKSFYKDNELNTSKFEIVDSSDAEQVDLTKYSSEKIVVKSCTGGYDGKGVAILAKSDVMNGKVSDVFKGQVVVEEYIEDAKELSVIVCRSRSGEIKTFPIVEMEFDPKINLVDYLFAPSSIEAETAEIATELAKNSIDKLNGVGIFAVELFLTKSGECLINEIAPRPHNSGHHTIEACYTSQYEQLIRIMLDLPLGDTSLISPAVMTNILGANDVTGDYNLEGLADLAKTKGAYLHWYNKTVTKPGRKMGHFTVLDESLDSAIATSKFLREKLKTVKP